MIVRSFPDLADALVRLVKDLTEPVSLDIETTGFELQGGDIVRGFAVGIGDQEWYFSSSHADFKFPHDSLVTVLECIREHTTVVMWNSPFDRTGIAERFGVEFRDEQIWDGQTVDWIINESADHRLKSVGARLFGIDAKREKEELDELMAGETVGEVYEELRRERLAELGVARLPAGEGRELRERARRRAAASKKTWATVTAEDIAPYACQDARLTLDIYEWQQDFLASNPEYTAGLAREFQVDGVAYRMRRTGVRIDRAVAERELEAATQRLEELAKEFPDVNLKSTPQVRKLLYETWGLPCTRRTKKTNLPSTDKAALAGLSYYPGVASILEFRKEAKRVGAFFFPLIDKVGLDGRIHPSWNAHRTVTGRWSCSGPNLQQIPREEELAEADRVRSIFVPRPGHVFVHADLPNAELRVVAELSGEPALIEAFERGDDIHQIVADASGISRQSAKVMNYQNLYGGGPRKLAETLNYAKGAAAGTVEKGRTAITTAAGHRGGDENPYKLISAAEAKRQWNAYWKGLPRVRRLMDGLGEYWVRHDRIQIRPWAGRFRHRENLLLGVPEPPYKCLNSVIQGSIAEAVKDWLLVLEDRLRESWFLVAQVHDAVVLEVPVGQERLAAGELQIAWNDANPFTRLDWPLDIEIGVF